MYVEGDDNADVDDDSAENAMGILVLSVCDSNSELPPAYMRWFRWCIADNH